MNQTLTVDAVLVPGPPKSGQSGKENIEDPLLAQLAKLTVVNGHLIVGPTKGKEENTTPTTRDPATTDTVTQLWKRKYRNPNFP